MATGQTPPERTLIVAGVRREHDLLEAITERARALQSSPLSQRMAREQSVLDVATSANEDDWLRCQLSMLNSRVQVDLEDCVPPDADGPLGALINLARRVLWKLVRFPSDWIIFHQNVVNEQLLQALEAERRLRRREQDVLRSRLEQLEAERTPTEEA